jgi:hypothetical protein
MFIYVAYWLKNILRNFCKTLKWVLCPTGVHISDNSKNENDGNTAQENSMTSYFSQFWTTKPSVLKTEVVATLKEDNSQS